MILLKSAGVQHLNKHFIKIIILFSLILIICPSCFKFFSKKNNKEQQISTEKIIISKNTPLDTEKMRSIINNSASINLDVFAAISVLHKDFVDKFAEEIIKLNEDEQTKFYEAKKIEFFKSIKYTENDYNNFMTANVDKINEYLTEHKEIAEFITTSN